MSISIDFLVGMIFCSIAVTLYLLYEFIEVFKEFVSVLKEFLEDE